MSEQQVWVVRAGKGGVWASEFEQRGEMNVGFAPVGDLTGAPRERVMELARGEFGEKGGSNAGGQLDAFANRIATGDLESRPRGTRESFCTVESAVHTASSPNPQSRITATRAVSSGSGDATATSCPNVRCSRLVQR